MPTCFSTAAEEDSLSACSYLDIVPATMKVHGSVPPMGTGTWMGNGGDGNRTDGVTDVARHQTKSKARSVMSFVA